VSQLLVAKQSRPGRLKRLAVIVAGWIVLALGVVGLFLPFLQGILFILIGLVILSKEYHWAGKLVSRLRSRFPKLDAWLTKAHQKVEGIFGHGPKKNARAARE
jgi:uncharacterized protein